MRKSVAETPAGEHEYVISSLAKWMLKAHARFHGLRRIPKDQKAAFLSRASEVVRLASKNNALRILKVGRHPVAIATIHPASNPRVPNQRSLFFIYDRRSRTKAAPWIKRTIRELARMAPKYSQVGLAPEDESIVRQSLKDNGFETRYEILVGDTNSALINLKKRKAPPRDLNHLGLTLSAITDAGQILYVMQLQK